ncbi:hypothetical protein RFI_21055 [Reticulomyxa filosa]|uniref:Endoplasmic reticulum vesicle transporter C-terminal domain-containing protein n=1 Tax=Reticulomyxa filosa TaxID=46433 RepID=X6MR15_RETFI|nr:hypothetical protein RFI_21055 [Reticulomyxa filosa]|eukprot:ETO16299.1 hypothetical protein RFI_21055 [Reticulomyxa filosa]
MGENELKTLLNDGCRIEANIEIKRVHGNIHISGHAHEDLLDVWIKYNGQIDLSHYIETWHFGNAISQEQMSIMTKVQNSLAFDPLNGFTSLTPPIYFQSDTHMSKSHPQSDDNPHDHHKIKITYEIVPTLFQDVDSEKLKSYQFTVSSNINENKYQTPIVFFRYDINPMTVEFVQKRRSLSHFAVQLSAIVGGTFVVFGLLHSILLVIDKKFFKDINKLY